MKRGFLLLALLLVPSARTQAQNPPLGALDALTRPRDGRILHASSNDPSGGNGDMRRIEPGQTLTLLDYRGGPGVVRRWWVTVAPRNQVALQRQTIVRCYWDGETEPSVETPLTDFFGMGFGEWKDFQSAPLNMTSGGYNCYWPMPFNQSAKITVENRSKVAIDAFYYNLDIETLPQAPREALYFHAQFRRARTRRGEPVTLLETTGRGHYVGTLLSMQFVNRRGIFFLEGDEQVQVDGETAPSILGTGTEDYFSSGWYFDTGPYSALYHGCPIKDDAKGRISAYRWHIPDPIPFRKSLHFAIEHGGKNDVPPADYCSVAFYYQTHPHAPFPPLPADLMPLPPVQIPRIEGAIEGESLVGRAKATEGNVTTQDMSVFDGDWSGLSQLWWLPTKAGSVLTLTIEIPEGRSATPVAWFTKAPDYGRVKLAVNGADIGEFDAYAPEVVLSGPIRLKAAALQPGVNTVTVEVIGKNAASKGYLFGLDGIRFE